MNEHQHHIGQTETTTLGTSTNDPSQTVQAHGASDAAQIATQSSTSEGTSDHETTAKPQMVQSATVVDTTSDQPVGASNLESAENVYVGTTKYDVVPAEEPVMTIPLAHVQGFVNSGIGFVMGHLSPDHEEWDALLTIIVDAEVSADPSVQYSASVARTFLERLRQPVVMTSGSLAKFDAKYVVNCEQLQLPVAGSKFTLTERSPGDESRQLAMMVAAGQSVGI